MTTDVVPILRVADASRAVDWYRRLGFELVFEHRFEPHLPAYLWVDDVDVVAAEFGVAVDDQAWAREVSLTDHR